MCKKNKNNYEYCKYLKCRDQKARLLLSKCLLVLCDVKFSFSSYGGPFDSFDDEFLFKQIRDFLKEN